MSGAESVGLQYFFQVHRAKRNAQYNGRRSDELQVVDPFHREVLLCSDVLAEANL